MSATRTALHRAVVLSGLLALLSCGGDGNGTEPPPENPITRVDVQPASQSVEIGQTAQFSATAFRQDGTQATAGFSWSSSDPSVATVDQNGTASGVAEGSVTVTATLVGNASVSGNAALTVIDTSPPAEVTNVRTRPLSDTEIEVTWDDNSDNEDEFLIEREEVGGGGSASNTAAVFVEAGRVGANVTTFVDSGLTPNTTYRYRVTACNENGCAPEAEDEDGDTSTPETLTIVDVTVPGGVVGQAYSLTLEADGGVGNFEWSLVDGGGPLPDGLSLSTAGVISGTPTAAGSFTFTVQVTSGGQEATTTLTVEVLATPVITTTELANGVRGFSYSAMVEAEGGDDSFSFEVIGGSFPPGLNLASDGSISGTPTATGTFTFTVQVSSAGLTASAELSIGVFEPLSITTGSVPNGVLNMGYGTQIAATGGNGVHTFELASGDLPDGLSLASDGTLAGTPTAVGTFTFTVRVSSGDGQTTTAEFTIEVTEQLQPPQVITDDLPYGVVGETYAGAQLQAVDGDGQNYTWALESGNLPPGLDLAADGSITGTPTATGTFTFTVRVTSAGMSSTAQLTIDVFEDLQITTAQLPTGVVGQTYNATVTTTGGSGNNTFAVTDGALPEGLDLNASTGVISGSPAALSALTSPDGGPSAVGTATFTITVTSSDMQTASDQLSITIYAVLQITTTSLPDAQDGVAYDETVQVTGGDGDNTFALTGGALPAGLNLDTSTGRISGTATAAGSFQFTVTVTSGDGQTASQTFTITVTAGPPTITTNTLPGGNVGSAYSTTLMASGGDLTYAWEIDGGNLPAGLGLDGASGVISGTPTVAGSFTFTVKVTSAGQSATADLTIVVTAGATSLDTDYLVGGSINESYTDEVSGSGGDGATYAYVVTAGQLPPGVSLDGATGALTGTPTTAGVFYFTIQVTSGGNMDSKTYAVAISSRPSSAFNMWVMNVTPGGIPSNAVITAVSDAVARWETIITADLADRNYGPNEFSSASCGGDGPKVNGQFLDDMMIMLNLGPIDGPGGTLGSAGPCSGRVLAVGADPGSMAIGTLPTINTTFGRLTLDTQDINNLTTVQAFALVFHEIGHIVGYGTWWESISSVGGTNLISGSGGPDPRYEGSNGNGAFVNDFGGGSQNAMKLPIEADGGAGTRDGHKDEGEFDHEIMTGFIENSGGMPISLLTIQMINDLGYVVDPAAADAYSIPACANTCLKAPGATEGIDLGDDIRVGPVTLELPDGRMITLDPGERR